MAKQTQLGQQKNSLLKLIEQHYADQDDLLRQRKAGYRASIPPAALDYRLGNRSALECVVDQYPVSTDKLSGIISDPNRDEDPEYIVRLAGQAIPVIIETVEIVNSLPNDSTDAAP